MRIIRTLFPSCVIGHRTICHFQSQCHADCGQTDSLSSPEAKFIDGSLPRERRWSSQCSRRTVCVCLPCVEVSLQIAISSRYSIDDQPPPALLLLLQQYEPPTLLFSLSRKPTAPHTQSPGIVNVHRFRSRTFSTPQCSSRCCYHSYSDDDDNDDDDRFHRYTNTRCSPPLLAPETSSDPVSVSASLQKIKYNKRRRRRSTMFYLHVELYESSRIIELFAFVLFGMY